MHVMPKCSEKRPNVSSEDPSLTEKETGFSLSDQGPFLETLSSILWAVRAPTLGNIFNSDNSYFYTAY